jgi:hypothetical protein
MTTAETFGAGEYAALLCSDFASFAQHCFHELNPRTLLAPGWHHDIIAAELAAVREGRTRRLIINQPPRGLNPLKSLWLGGHGWKIGWKILFSLSSGHP